MLEPNEHKEERLPETSALPEVEPPGDLPSLDVPGPEGSSHLRHQELSVGAKEAKETAAEKASPATAPSLRIFLKDPDSRSLFERIKDRWEVNPLFCISTGLCYGALAASFLVPGGGVADTTLKVILGLGLIGMFDTFDVRDP